MNELTDDVGKRVRVNKDLKYLRLKRDAEGTVIKRPSANIWVVLFGEHSAPLIRSEFEFVNDQ